MHPIPTPVTADVADVAAVEPDMQPRTAPPMGLIWAAGLLLIAGVFFPQGQVLQAVAENGGSASAGGFLLLRILLVLCGVVLTVVARTGLGVQTVGVLRMPGSEARSGGRLEMTVLAGLVLLAAALRLPELGAGLWHDEIATLLQQVRQPMVTILTSFESQNNHPLYSLLAKLSIAIFGDTPAALRVPSVMFGLGSIAAVYWFGTLVARPIEALLAAGLLAVSYHHVWFSQNARGYTALLFFALIGTALLVRLCSGRTRPGESNSAQSGNDASSREQSGSAGANSARGIAIGYAAVMAMAVYAHLTAGLIVAGHFLVWAVAAGRGGRWRDAWASAPALAFLLAGLFSLVLYAPGVAAIAGDLGGSGKPLDVEWKNPVWMLAETVSGLARGIPGGVFTLAIAAAAPIAGLLSYGIRAGGVTALMIVPPLLTAAVMLATGHNLWPRFFFFAAGFALLILVRGVFAIATRIWPGRADALGIAVVLLVFAASAALVPSAWGPKQDYAGALAYIEQERAPEDAIAAVGIADFAYRSYFSADWPSVATPAELKALEVVHRRTWLVYAMPELVEARTPELWSMIQRDFRQVALFRGTLAGGAIHVMVTE